MWSVTSSVVLLDRHRSDSFLQRQRRSAQSTRVGCVILLTVLPSLVNLRIDYRAYCRGRYLGSHEFPEKAFFSQ